MPSIRITRAGIKAVARFIVARAVSTSISLVVAKNTDPESQLEIASVHIGAFVIGEWAGEAIKPFVNEQIDEAFDFLGVLKEEPKPEPEEEPAS